MHSETRSYLEWKNMYCVSTEVVIFYWRYIGKAKYSFKLILR